ncbi:hypothetical protein HYT17_00055 [Candidatus Microgenomates bacterium]|nr:hypothetical protein [Candidatus Microgenomates bacterium]
MATLSQTTKTTKSILKWAVILFAAFLVFRLILFPLGRFLFLSIFPSQPPAPTVAFGKLPKIPFPPGQKLETATFEIKTTTGALPSVPTTINVYAVAKPRAIFSSLDLAKQKVKSIGFASEEIPLSKTLYQWRDPQEEGKQITLNTVTQEFTLITKLASSSAEIANIPPQKEEAIAIAKDFLARMELLPKDLDEEKTKITLLRIRNNALVAASSLSQSDFVQVDFYRKTQAEIPIVYPKADQSLISFLIKADRASDKQVVKAQYSYKEINQESFSTYPVKTAQEAFDDLKTGKAYIVKKQRALPVIAIQKVYLSYWENNDELNFFLPVFVFEGEGDFLAFVSALKESWQE